VEQQKQSAGQVACQTLQLPQLQTADDILINSPITALSMMCLVHCCVGDEDGDDAAGGDGEDDDDVEDAAAAAAKQAKSAAAGKRGKGTAAREEATLATAEALRQKKVDNTFAVDPLFHKMSALFDEGGAKGECAGT
jgi:hypothetical protein